MNTQIKWQKDLIGDKSEIDGFGVSRVKLQSGRFQYYVHWIENPHYAAPHNQMSQRPVYSIRTLREQIEALKNNPNCVSRAEFRKMREAN